MSFNGKKVWREAKAFIAGAKTGGKHIKPDGTVIDSHDPIANSVTEGARKSPQTAMRIILALVAICAALIVLLVIK